MSDSKDERGPDLTQGVPLGDLGEKGLLRGHVGDKAVVLARHGDEVLAIGADCTHYGGPLDQGLVVGDTVRCPWHHACFSLRTGEAVGAPAIDPVTTWGVERDGDRIVVREQTTAEVGVEQPEQPEQAHEATADRPKDVLIIGGGAAGFACAEMLRRHDFTGRITILSADVDAPYDRPNLSKDFLAGGISEKWMPLRGTDFYRDNDIDLHLETRVESLDLQAHTATVESGTTHEFDTLVLTTGAEPVHLRLPGADLDHVFTLRSTADCKRIIAAAEGAKTAVVLGSGFIGLETAAALTQRGLSVHVVSLDSHPLERVVGRPVSERIQAEHEKHGTVFHLEKSLTRIEKDSVELDDGTRIEAELVLLGVGVKPRVDLAESAGLKVDNGVVVDECLRAGPGVYAGGDIARWPDAASGEDIRVEHWVLAERHGQHIARNILNGDTPFRDVPFFWSAHHDVAFRYVGHAEDWDELDIDGDVGALDARIRFRKDGRTLAVATLGRDLEALEWEAEQERAE